MSNVESGSLHLPETRGFYEILGYNHEQTRELWDYFRRKINKGTTDITFIKGGPSTDIFTIKPDASVSPDDCVVDNSDPECDVLSVSPEKIPGLELAMDLLALRFADTRGKSWFRPRISLDYPSGNSRWRLRRERTITPLVYRERQYNLIKEKFYKVGLDGVKDDNSEALYTNYSVSVPEDLIDYIPE